MPWLQHDRAQKRQMSPRVHKACGAAAGRPCVRPAGRPRRAAPCAMCSCRFRAQPCWRALTLLDRRWCAPNRVHTCADSRAGGPPRDGSASRARVRSSRRAAAVARPAVCTPHAPSLLGLPAVAAATRQPPARGLLWTRSVATVPWRTSPPLRGHERARPQPTVVGSLVITHRRGHDLQLCRGTGGLPTQAAAAWLDVTVFRF